MTDNVLAGTSSLTDIASAFHAARDPDVAMLSGDHHAELLGPVWLRVTGRALMSVTGMPRWYGKSFGAPSPDGVVSGANLLQRNGGIERSIPMTASVELSPFDGRPALVVRYPTSARWPWRGVADHLRPLGDDVLLGLTFGIPGSPGGGAPFLLRRFVRQP